MNPVAGPHNNAEGSPVATRSICLDRLALFIVGTDTRPIALWQGPAHIASLSIEHHPDRIVAISTDRERYSRPFFANIHELVQFADDHIPFDGDRRLALSDEEKCAISPPDDGCPSDDALSNAP